MKKILKQPYRGRVEAWIENLRSGKYKQGIGCLLDFGTQGYCCLGVACDLSNLHPWVGSFYAERAADMSDDVLDWYGLCRGGMDNLIALNDTHKWTFGQIASHLEFGIRNPGLGLFMEGNYRPELEALLPSELLEVALKDLEFVEQMPMVYEVDMSQWYSVGGDVETCMVCLAGAVMAKECHFDRTRNCGPMTGEFAEIRGPLLAIDSFRKGSVDQGLTELNRSRPESMPMYMAIESYSADRDKFFSDMQNLISKLKEAGL